MATAPERAAAGHDWDEIHDAVLVGSGTGSLTAAIRLAARGLRPLVVERAESIGGASAYSGGVVWAPDNHLMRAQGMADSAAEALTYLDAVSLGRGDAAVARAYVERIPATLEWLERETELAWTIYRGLPDYFAEIPGGKADGRCLLPRRRVVSAALEAAARRVPELAAVRPSVHFPAETEAWAAGRALVGCLWLRVVEDGTPFALATRATSLVVAGGAVVGIEAEGPEGRRRIGARHGVLLDSGGFEWDAAMTRAAVPGPAPIPQTPPGMCGDGRRMGAAVGAAVALLDQTISTPAVMVPGELNEGRPLCRIFFQELALPHSIVVNRAGSRFANETFFQDLARGWSVLDGDDATYPNLPMFFVFDAAYRARHGLPAGIAPGSYLSVHGSLAELAAARGIDPAGLIAQVERFNRDAARGLDPQFGRGATAYQRAFAPPAEDGGNPTLGPLTEPPFHCMEIFPGTSGHRGGLVCDGSARVLGTDGGPIPGLFACGAAAAGSLTGGSYLTGTSLGNALAFGDLAAAAIGEAALGPAS